MTCGWGEEARDGKGRRTVIRIEDKRGERSDTDSGKRSKRQEEPQCAARKSVRRIMPHATVTPTAARSSNSARADLPQQQAECNQDKPNRAKDIHELYGRQHGDKRSRTAACVASRYCAHVLLVAHPADGQIEDAAQGKYRGEWVARKHADASRAAFVDTRSHPIVAAAANVRRKCGEGRGRGERGAPSVRRVVVITKQRITARFERDLRSSSSSTSALRPARCGGDRGTCARTCARAARQHNAGSDALFRRALCARLAARASGRADEEAEEHGRRGGGAERSDDEKGLRHHR